MKLDFSLLSQPNQEYRGPGGHVGQPMFMLVPESTELSPVSLNEGDTSHFDASTDICPPLSPVRPPSHEARGPNGHEGVPPVRHCPTENSRGLQTADRLSSEQGEQ
jgi:hypothetical protein